MKKRIPLIAIVLTLVMIVTACYPAQPLNEIPHFSERNYVKIEESQFVTLLNEAVNLSTDEANGTKVIAKMLEVKNLSNKLSDAQTLSNIFYSQNVTTDKWTKELSYCMNTSRKVYNLIKECEKTLFKSAVKDTLIVAYGADYVESVLVEVLPTEEQLALLEEETQLANQHGGLISAKKYDEVQELYLNLVKVRKKIAVSFGFDNFSDYSYAVNFSRDYSPDEAAVLAAEIKEYIAPIVRVVQTAVNPLMYTTRLDETKLMSTVKEVVREIGNNKLIDNFNYLTKYGLYDVKVSDTKEDTAYCIDFLSYDDAFLFVDADGQYGDLSTMIHEFGHFSEVLTRDKNKAGDSGLNYDLAESHSQGMEVLSMPVLEKILAPELFKSYSLNSLKRSFNVLSMQVMFDEFEQSVYDLTEAQLSSPDIYSTFTNLYNELIEAYGYSKESMGSYFFIPHFFFTGLYCISYAVSLMVALQLATKDFGSKPPVDVYMNLLSYGTSNPLLGTLRKVGLDSPFSEDTVFNLAKYLAKNLQEAGVNCPVPQRSIAA